MLEDSLFGSRLSINDNRVLELVKITTNFRGDGLRPVLGRPRRLLHVLVVLDAEQPQGLGLAPEPEPPESPAQSVVVLLGGGGALMVPGGPARDQKPPVEAQLAFVVVGDLPGAFGAGGGLLRDPTAAAAAANRRAAGTCNGEAA